MSKDWSKFVQKKIKEYNLAKIVFTKNKLLNWLVERNKSNIEDMKEEIHNLKDLVYVEKQVIIHKGKEEERFRCYFVYSSSRGKCYILRFNHQVKIITVFPLGRTTLKRYRKRFK